MIYLTSLQVSKSEISRSELIAIGSFQIQWRERKETSEHHLTHPSSDVVKHRLELSLPPLSTGGVYMTEFKLYA